MQVGDLVKCLTAGREDGRIAMGIIVEKFKTSGMFNVMLIHNNAVCCFQPQHLEKMNVS